MQEFSSKTHVLIMSAYPCFPVTDPSVWKGKRIHKPLTRHFVNASKTKSVLWLLLSSHTGGQLPSLLLVVNFLVENEHAGTLGIPVKLNT